MVGLGNLLNERHRRRACHNLAALHFQGTDIGDAYSAAGWAALASPLFIGMVADRFFAAEKVLGVLHLLGGGCLYWASTISDPNAFFYALLLTMLCYMPTLALVNAISFQQMSDPGSEFPNVRVLGTIGWIVAGWLVGTLGIESTVQPMQIAAVASLLLGLYAFSLPHTPPRLRGKKWTLPTCWG